ncbi:MAG: N-acetyltransferase family protein [Rudaea sp.]
MPDQSIVVEEIDARDLPAMRDRIAGVYRAAFALPPYNEGEPETEAAMQSLLQHSRREGFRFRAARTAQGELVGFAYGYRGQDGQWWHDYVARFLDPQPREKWLSDCFQFVDIAVLPDRQRGGIGGQLLEATLDGLPYETAALTAFAGDNPALRLFLNHGWQILISDLVFPNTASPIVLLGRELTGPKRRET